jgi:hypothetical protein
MSLPASPATSRIEILEAFTELPDVRQASGKRHQMTLCLALFTLAVTAGNRGFLAIGDWLNSYHRDLIELFDPPKQRLPSYSTIRRVLLKVDYQAYSAALARFFEVDPLPGEMLAVDGKVLRGSYQLETETRYYVASFIESAEALAQRIRGYWGVENKVHYVRDVTQGEDASRIRMQPLPQVFAVARNFALNLYRSNNFDNMAQAERCCKYGLDTLKRVFRMK